MNHYSLLSIYLFVCRVFCNDVITINTLSEAETNGIRILNNTQCRSWNLWWKSEIGDVQLTNEDIELLAIRKKTIVLKNSTEYDEFGIPDELRTKEIHINLENSCRENGVQEQIDLTFMDDYIDWIMDARSSSQRPLPSSTIIPFLRRAQYDPRQLPQKGKVTVKLGILIQSMSNFELSTMDYDLDVWVRMTWIDTRLVHGLSRPILINNYEFLKLIWRPDPIFTNTKASTLHKVSFINFYMLIYPDGRVFMDVRVYLKPTAAQIVLCKYPHDNPSVLLKISSMAFTNNIVEFEWFHQNPIIMEKDVRIPELTIKNVESDICNGARKSGNYSCLEARILMHREAGYHIANTYIPTAICVVFSWISVWLPEEFVEGRIFVSLTVFLTLSAENNSAKEELPKVSYVKAIDIWFGFTSTFVFLTMVQALIVISLEHNSRKLAKKCETNLERYGKFQLTKSLLLSRYYHKLARQIDTFCKIMYPVTFLLFLMLYSFVITQGEEKKCLKSYK